MRNSGQPSRNSKENIFARQTEESLRDLFSRVERLEKKVFFSLHDVFADKKHPRPKGRKPKLAVDEVVKRRNALVLWIEENWPEFELAIRKAKKPADVMLAIMNARAEGTYPFQPEFYRDPERFSADLWDFLKSGRYHGNPRDLAGAMAGLPELSWKRSFDISSRNQCTTFKNKRAYRDYLRRKFPERLRQLLRCRNEVEVKKVLNRSRTKDQHYRGLKLNSEHVLEWLASGVPRQRLK